MHFLIEHGAALLFYLFAAVTLAGGVGVISLRNRRRREQAGIEEEED